MLKELTYRKKNVLLLIGVILFTLLVYGLSISETVALVKDKQHYQEQLKNSQTAPAQIAQLESTLKKLDNSLGDADSYIDFQQVLLEKVTLYCEKKQLNLSSFPKPFSAENDNYRLQTFQFEVEGSFHAALELIYMLEEKWQLGRAVSSRFHIKENFRTKEKKLHMTLFIQSVKTI